MFQFTMPYPPSNNTYKRHVCTVNGSHRVTAYLTTEARTYKDVVGWTVGRIVAPLDGDVGLVIRAYRPRKSGDIDNILKVVLDSLQGIAFHNDSQVVALQVHRYDDPANPRIEVEVVPIPAKGVM